MSDRPAPPPGERLAKAIARAGICSRRDAESWITQGRIAVNGSVVKTPAFNVVDADTIAVDGKEITRRQATQLWLYHKPAGLMVTEKDPEGRPTVFEALSRLGLPRVLTVGRLDYNTEGLLLLTNDGGLKRTLELPSTGWVRRYRVRAFGSVTQEKLDTLKNGISVDGIEYGPIDAELDSASGANVWITMGLREGKNREVRNVLGALGLEVNRLIRISYGPFQLGDLPSGHVEKVKTRVLRDQLGKKLADASGADFETPEADEGQPRRRGPQRENRVPERSRFGGVSRRPDNRREERPEEPPRTVHFDDGRPSETFVPKGKSWRDKDGGRDARPARGEGFRKRSDDGPRRSREEGGRPVRGDARAAEGGKPFRKEGYRPRGEKSDTSSFGDRPPRRDGAKPYAKGPRREFDGERPPRRRDDERPQARNVRSGRDNVSGEDRRPARAGGKPSDRSGPKNPGRGPQRGNGRPPRGGKPPSNRPRRPRSE